MKKRAEKRYDKGQNSVNRKRGHCAFERMSSVRAYFDKHKMGAQKCPPVEGPLEWAPRSAGHLQA